MALAATVAAILVRFAVLRFLSIWVFRIIGFGPLGPIGGTLVTAWQAGYMGFVPAGGLFAFLQSLAMQLA